MAVSSAEEIITQITIRCDQNRLITGQSTTRCNPGYSRANAGILHL